MNVFDSNDEQQPSPPTRPASGFPAPAVNQQGDADDGGSPRSNFPLSTEPPTTFAPPAFSATAPGVRPEMALPLPPQRKSSSKRLWIGLIAAVLVVGGMIASQFSGTAGTGSGVSSLGGNRSYSAYHDRYFDSDSYSPQWEKSGMLDSEKWRYDGTYEYGVYGSKGMKNRREGKGDDPIYGAARPLPDVFEQYGSGGADGAPVGEAWNQWLDPTYSPYSGYSNPYANQIRMAWGPGGGRNAYQDYP